MVSPTAVFGRACSPRWDPESLNVGQTQTQPDSSSLPTSKSVPRWLLPHSHSSWPVRALLFSLTDRQHSLTGRSGSAVFSPPPLPTQSFLGRDHVAPAPDPSAAPQGFHRGLRGLRDGALPDGTLPTLPTLCFISRLPCLHHRLLTVMRSSA